MCKPLSCILMGLVAVSMGTSCSKTPDDRNRTVEAPQFGSEGERDAQVLNVAVVTGGHAFDVPNFYRLFRQLPGIDAYPQHIEHFASSPENVRDSYDAIIFYGMDQGVPEEEGRRGGGNPKAAIERLIERGQGIVVLHHALLAWEKWDLWNQLIGFDNRNFRYKEGLTLEIEVGDEGHPITKGVNDFSITDEGYVLHGKHDGKGTILLTTVHDDAMDQVGWARQHGKCRVFCLALGHDNLAWSNPGFREVLYRGIAWSADDTIESDDAEGE